MILGALRKAVKAMAYWLRDRRPSGITLPEVRVERHPDLADQIRKRRAALAEAQLQEVKDSYAQLELRLEAWPLQQRESGDNDSGGQT